MVCCDDVVDKELNLTKNSTVNPLPPLERPVVGQLVVTEEELK